MLSKNIEVVKGVTKATRRGFICVLVTPKELKSSLGSIGGYLGKEGKSFLGKALAREKFSAKPFSTLIVTAHPREKVEGLLLVGWDPKQPAIDRGLNWRKLGNKIALGVERFSSRDISLDTTSVDDEKGAAAAILEGVLLTLYSYDVYRSSAKLKDKIKITLFGTISQNKINRTLVLSDSTAFARDLVNHPARHCTPAFMVQHIRKLVTQNKNITMRVFTKSELRRMKADLMLSVFDSSNEEPFLVKMHYRPSKKAKRKIALVGKGVTFDTGGLSIKSGAGMFDMKSDMAGAAAVIETLRAAAILKLPIEIIAFTPLTENMIRDTSTKPGDVLRALNGRTIEVLNTDAEGRLILGDSLVLAERERPDTIIDLSTLTGSIVSALGSDYAGFFSTDDELAEKLLEAASSCGERLWRMPLATDYRDRLKSGVADMRNIGGGEAGAITAALFLKEFVEKTPWAHFDMGGPAHIDNDKGYMKKGGTGWGVRTLFTFLESV